MKRQILTSLILLVPILAMNAQWNGTNPVYTNSNVGIGTTTPTKTLEVNGSIKFGGSTGFNLLTGNATNAYIGQTNLGTENPETNSGYFFGINPRMGADRLLVIEARTNDGPGAITFNTYSGAGVGRAPERMRLTNKGYLGIGTTTPNTTLEVNGGIKFGGNTSFNLLTRNATNSYIGQTDLGTEDPETNSGYFFGINPRMGADRLLVIEARTNDGPGAITFNTYSGVGVGRAPERMRLTNNGYLGIGTTTPSESLHVIGNSIITGKIKAGYISGSITQTSTYPYSTTIETGADAGQIIINAGSTNGCVSQINISGRTNGNGIQFITRSSEIMRISDGGNVGIGTTNPQNALDVNGTIRAKEVKVETGWADFVFTPTYKLRPLSEVEQFIKTNGHLPEIPKAEEVQQNGVNLGEMQTKLLQKVEELTLYSIELAKENTALRQKLDEQEAKYLELKQLIEELRTTK